MYFVHFQKLFTLFLTLGNVQTDSARGILFLFIIECEDLETGGWGCGTANDWCKIAHYTVFILMLKVSNHSHTCRNNAK